MDYCHQFRITVFQRLFYLGRINGLAPRRVDSMQSRSAPFDYIAHAITEHAVHAYEGFIARLEQVDETRLHARAARSGNSKGKRIFRAKDLAQHVLDAVHNFDELRVEMAYQRRSHGLQNTRMRIAGARPHKDSWCRIQFSRYGHLCSPLCPNGPKTRKTFPKDVALFYARLTRSVNKPKCAFGANTNQYVETGGS